MSDAHANFAYTVVATAPSPASSGTSLVVLAGTGALFPAVPFNATVWPYGANPATTNAEIVRVTNRSTDTLTITRTQEGSSARAIGVGDIIAATITAATIVNAEGYPLKFDHAVWSPADATTYYWGGFPTGGPGTTANLQTLMVPKAGTITTVQLTILIAGTNGTGENGTFILRVNGSDAVTLTSTKVFNGGSNTQINVTYSGLTQAVAVGDKLEFKESCPTFATNPTGIVQTAIVWVS